MNKRIAAGVVAAGLVGGGIALSAPAMAVGTDSVGGLGFAKVTATVTNYGTYLQACVTGDARTLWVTGEWQMSLTGTRSDGSTINLPASASGVPTFNSCTSVPKNRAAAGNVTIQLQYIGAGGQVYGSGSQSGAWGPANINIITP